MLWDSCVYYLYSRTILHGGVHCQRHLNSIERTSTYSHMVLEILLKVGTFLVEPNGSRRAPVALDGEWQGPSRGVVIDTTVM